ncbi:MAG: aldo/keto reductase, partial [Nocardia sp.]|nr:aldo/keto reductase [Nocardia sp.]
IAWVLSRGGDIVPVIGARTRSRWSEALDALDVSLTAADIAAVESAVPAASVAGSRYAQSQMRALDSER